jgi:hypothetical protein
MRRQANNNSNNELTAIRWQVLHACHHRFVQGMDPARIVLSFRTRVAEVDRNRHGHGLIGASCVHLANCVGLVESEGREHVSVALRAGVVWLYTIRSQLDKHDLLGCDQTHQTNQAKQTFQTNQAKQTHQTNHAKQSKAEQSKAKQSKAQPKKKAKHSTAQHSTAQQSTAQHRKSKHSTGKHGKVE